jgi:hypothetical protein
MKDLGLAAGDGVSSWDSQWVFLGAKETMSSLGMAASAIAISGTKSQISACLIGVVRGYVPYNDVAISQQTGLNNAEWKLVARPSDLFSTRAKPRRASR